MLDRGVLGAHCGGIALDLGTLGVAMALLMQAATFVGCGVGVVGLRRGDCCKRCVAVGAATLGAVAVLKMVGSCWIQWRPVVCHQG